jgi:hypothetical protein
MLREFQTSDLTFPIRQTSGVDNPLTRVPLESTVFVHFDNLTFQTDLTVYFTETNQWLDLIFTFIVSLFNLMARN